MSIKSAVVDGHVAAGIGKRNEMETGGFFDLHLSYKTIQIERLVLTCGCNGMHRVGRGYSSANAKRLSPGDERFGAGTGFERCGKKRIGVGKNALWNFRT